MVITTEPKETSNCNGFDPRPDNQRQQILKNAKETDFLHICLGGQTISFHYKILENSPESVH